MGYGRSFVKGQSPKSDKIFGEFWDRPGADFMSLSKTNSTQKIKCPISKSEGLSLHSYVRSSTKEKCIKKVKRKSIQKLILHGGRGLL
jgi:hypothetical protein